MCHQERHDDDEAACDALMLKMYDMILALSARNRVLEDKVEELTKWAAIRKKRLHVVQWLNDNYQETCSFNDYICEFEIDKTHFELVTKYDYVDGIYCILKKMFPVDEESKLPIMAFDQKDNTLFIKKEDGWHQFAIEEYQMFIGSIGKKYRHFVNYRMVINIVMLTKLIKKHIQTIFKVLGGTIQNAIQIHY